MRTTQFVVVESSHSDAKWYHYYVQLLNHFYWASVWWPPNATVQQHNPEGLGGGVSLKSEANLESSLHVVERTDDEQDDYESCSDGGTSEGGSVYSCNSRIISNRTGSRYFHQDFDEHGQDLPDYGCTSERVEGSQHNSSCLQERKVRWPSRRKKRSAVGGKADTVLQASDSLLSSAPRWEVLPQGGQLSSGDPATTSRVDGRLTGDVQGSQDDAPENEFETCDWCGAWAECAVLDDEVVCTACHQKYDFSPANHQQNQDPEMCMLCDLRPAAGWCDGWLATCRSCGMHLSYGGDGCGTDGDEEDEDDDSEPDSDSEFDGVAASRLMFPPGKFECQLRGLVSSASRNGQWAAMWLFHRDKGRWEVSVSGERILVKMENMDMSTLRLSPGS